MSSEIKKIDDGADGLTVLQQTLNGLTAVLAGIVASDQKDWALSIGYLLQRVRGGHFLETLLKEINKYRAKGQIKDDYFQTEQCINCLQEILDCIDRDSPDDVRFNAMKMAFIQIASEQKSNRDDQLPAQLMRICRSLSSAEILILAASHKMVKSEEARMDSRPHEAGFGQRSVWLAYVVRATGLRFTELVQLHEKQLIERNLLTPDGLDATQFQRGGFYHLTALGHHLCTFIGDYTPAK